MILRSCFILSNIILGITLGLKWSNGSRFIGILVAACMLCLSLAFMWYERNVFTHRPIETLGGLVGLSFGLCLSGITSLIIRQFFSQPSELASLFSFTTLIGFCFMGPILGPRITTILFAPHGTSNNFPTTPTQKILDTSAIIDGRIADLCQTGFLEGPVIVPQCVLLELQRISDSSDSHKRIRGKRGLEALQTIQEIESIDVHIVHDDFPQIQAVDSKLVELAKQLRAKLSNH